MKKRILIIVVVTIIQILLFTVIYEGGLYLGKLTNLISEERGVSWGITLRVIFLIFIAIAVISNVLYVYLKKNKGLLIAITSAIIYASSMYLFNDMSTTTDKALLLLLCGIISFYIGNILSARFQKRKSI
jgi:hypothetical protein